MKIAVFTSNQPRHLSLIERLASVADEVVAVVECNTVFPGEVQDFYGKTEVMRRYFTRVIAAETTVFGRPRFLPAAVRALPLKMGDLNRLEPAALAPALDADAFIVFGASYIKGALCDALVERGAYNIHMGLSPYYRGSGCNFWALYDGRPDRVGATVHLLTKGLDSGPMVFHAVPAPEAVDGFELGMRAVEAAHQGLAARLADGSLRSRKPVLQDKALELRSSRYADFTDAVVEEYLGREIPAAEIARALSARRDDDLLHPFIGRRPQ
ncbi:MAG: formyltransferase family protein [Elusimicrobiota bacterium]|nr:formyltransferase family protein [Elusimicrobiota bacterium]